MQPSLVWRVKLVFDALWSKQLNDGGVSLSRRMLDLIILSSVPSTTWSETMFILGHYAVLVEENNCGHFVPICCLLLWLRIDPNNLLLLRFGWVWFCMFLEIVQEYIYICFIYLRIGRDWTLHEHGCKLVPFINSDTSWFRRENIWIKSSFKPTNKCYEGIFYQLFVCNFGLKFSYFILWVWMFCGANKRTM